MMQDQKQQDQLTAVAQILTDWLGLEDITTEDVVAVYNAAHGIKGDN